MNPSNAREAVQEYQRLNWRQRFRLRIFGQVYLEHRTRPGWTGAEPHYLVKCKRHGLYVQYPQGFQESLPCHECWHEPLELIDALNMNRTGETPRC